jgi:hypothetical protein
MKVKQLIIYFTSGREFMAADVEVHPTKNPNVFSVIRDNTQQRVCRDKVDYLEMVLEDDRSDA